jgi:hypothetical protein
MPTKPSIDLGTLQTAYQNARRTHALNVKALAKAQDAAKRSKATFDSAQAALEDAARNVLANG